MQTALFRNWTHVAVSISYDSIYFTTNASIIVNDKFELNQMLELWYQDQYFVPRPVLQYILDPSKGRGDSVAR